MHGGQDRLRQANEALARSEERFRDLFDEAPVAYVNEGLNSRFIRANKTALNILGINSEDAVGSLGRSLAPPTDEAQHRVDDALGSINRCIDTSSVVLELRRHDNSKPVWIQWWSRPDPSGAYTRTMFIDITDVVMMEQEKRELQAHNANLKEVIEDTAFGEIIGTSHALHAVLDDVKQVACTGYWIATAL